MIIFLCMLSIASVVSQQPPNPAMKPISKTRLRHWMMIRGIELIGKDITSVTEVDHQYDVNIEIDPHWDRLDICKRACESTRGCESWSFDASFSDGTCFLKKSPKNYFLDPDVISYVKTPVDYECRPRANFYGVHLFNFTSSYNECVKECNRNRYSCNGFTWILNENLELGQCFLKSLPHGPQTLPNFDGAITCHRTTILPDQTNLFCC
jgi:hypothetical protein